ncbi:MAG: hypothetical protein NW217_14345 [Hyphomicrobiaceae bacterium]|nr:hypothetical protein [Hyphomicrobiaceae bacterium]
MLVGLALALPPVSTSAQEAKIDAATSAAGTIAVELNRLEPLETGCRLYVVVDNRTRTPFSTLQLDLVLFRTDGVVDQRFFVDLAPLRKDKRIVKLFEIDNVKCSDLGSLLVNDVNECRSDKEAVADCLSLLTVSSLAPAKLLK